MRTPATRLLGIDLPLVSPASADPAFCAKMCEMGGLGVLDARALPPSALGDAMQAIRRSTARPFAVVPARRGDGLGDGIEALLGSWRPVVVASAAELALVAFCKAAGLACLCRLDSPDQARAAATAGAGGLVVALPEPARPETAWKPVLRTASSGAPGIPLIASGPFKDGVQAMAALASGADAVQPWAADPGDEATWAAWAAGLADAARHCRPEPPPPAARPGRTAAAEPSQGARALREAAALRDNLRRRKAQARARGDTNR